MRARSYTGATVLLALVLALNGWKAALAAQRWVRAPAEARASGAPTARAIPVRAAPGSPLHPIAASRRALVFVFSPDCSVSRANTANWTALVRQARGAKVEIFAVGPVDARAARAYWGGLGRRVRVLSAPAKEIEHALGVQSTPVTMMVANGRVRAQAAGPLRDAARDRLAAFARGADAE